MAAYFSPASLKFLRSLKRNNRREWFTPRKEQFEAELRFPMLALIKDLNAQMENFAPHHIHAPEKTIMRIYRDTRFSANKLPYKTHVSAWWAHNAMLKTSGAGFYLHLSQDELLIAAGVFMPQREQLFAIRNYLLTHYADMQRLLKSKPLRAALPDLDVSSLSRPPKGFPADHPAIDLLRCTQWGLAVSLPAAEALKPTLLREVLRRFKLAAPLVNLLNAPLVGEVEVKPRTTSRKPLFPLPGF